MGQSPFSAVRYPQLPTLWPQRLFQDERLMECPSCQVSGFAQLLSGFARGPECCTTPWEASRLLPAKQAPSSLHYTADT